MNHDMQPADKDLRKKTPIFLFAAATVSLLAILGLLSVLARIRATAAEDPLAAVPAMKALAYGLAAINLACTLAGAVYFFRLFQGILASGRYPPPGYRVLKNTPIRTGVQAKIMAALCLLVVALLLATNGLFLIVHRVATSFP